MSGAGFRQQREGEREQRKIVNIAQSLAATHMKSSRKAPGARSVDVSFRCPPVTSRRRQRTHARASTPKGERACRAANASQEKPTRGHQQHTPPTTTAWQRLCAAPTPPRGQHLPFEGHDHSPTPLQQTRFRSLLHRTNKPPRAVWPAAVHHIPSTPWAQRAASSLPCPPPH